METEIISEFADKIMSFLEKQKTEEFRKQVEADLETIKDELGEFISEFSRFANEQELIDLQQSIGNPIQTVELWYKGDNVHDSVTQWLRPDGQQPPSQELKSDIEQKARMFLVQLYQCITSDTALVPDQKLWMTYYFNWISQDIDKKNWYMWNYPFMSASESLFMYFYYTCALQIKILVAAKWASLDAVITDYSKALKLNLKDEGAVVQSQVNNWIFNNGVLNADWSDITLNDPSLVSKDFQTYFEFDCMINTGFLKFQDENHTYVIYDFGMDISSSEPHTYVLKAQYGTLNSMGYVVPVGTAESDGPKTNIGYSPTHNGVGPYVGYHLPTGNFMTDVSPDEVVVNMAYQEGTDGESFVLTVITRIPIIKEGIVTWKRMEDNPNKVWEKSYSSISLTDSNLNTGFVIMGSPVTANSKVKRNYPPLNTAYMTLAAGKYLNGVDYFINSGRQAIHSDKFGIAR